MNTCNICGNKLLKRDSRPIRGLGCLYCKKCKKSQLATLQEVMDPKTKDARRAVKRAEQIVGNTRSLATVADNFPKFRILVWGANSSLAKKRLEIKSELIYQGHDAKFSEELVSDFNLAGKGLQHNERDQLEWAHIVIILSGENGYGVLGEIHDHAQFLKSGRTYIWFPGSAKSGYSAQGTLNQLSVDGVAIEDYTSEEVAICILKTMSIEFVKRLQQGEIYRNKLIQDISSKKIIQ